MAKKKKSLNTRMYIKKKMQGNKKCDLELKKKKKTPMRSQYKWKKTEKVK